MQAFAFIQAASFMALVVVFGTGLMYVASMSSLNDSEISINGNALPGLQKVWEKDALQTFFVWYYIVGIIFMLEFYMQFGHFVLAYTVACWYFTDNAPGNNTHSMVMSKALGGGIGKFVQVRVGGVDAVYGQRQGKVVTGQGGKFLVVPVEKKMPGINRNDLMTDSVIKPTGPSLFSMGQGALAVLVYHAGSLAVGSVFIFFLRPFRLAEQMIMGFLTRIADPQGGAAHDADPHKANIKACLSLLTAFLEQVLARYSKTAFTDLVLSGGTADSGTFVGCSNVSFDFLVRAGGSIAYMYNSMFLYELFGTLSITVFSGWVCMIFQDKLDMFAEPTGSYYIEDKTASTIACMLIAFAISFAWMSMWNQTADVLLYCLAWNRQQTHVGHANKLPHHSIIAEPDTFCSQALRNLIPDYERESRYEHGLHAHGLGQQGAILAAMEHGAMNGVGSAPDYSKATANAAIMATRMVG